MKDVAKATTGKNAQSDMLHVICLLSSWNPVCAHVEVGLEEANYVLDTEKQCNESSPSSHIQVTRPLSADYLDAVPISQLQLCSSSPTKLMHLKAPFSSSSMTFELYLCS